MISALGLLAAFIRRDWTIARSYRFAFLVGTLSSVGSLAIPFFLGRLIGHDASGARAGFSHGYFSFAAIGLVTLFVMHSGLTASANRLREDQTTGVLEALVASPTPVWILVLGGAAFDLLEAAASGVVTLLLGLALFGLDAQSSPTALGAAVLATLGLLVFALSLGVVLAALTVVVKKATGAVGLLTTALSLLSGVYVPISVLPSSLEAVGRVLPFTWGLDALREALLDGEFAGGRIAALSAVDVLLLPASLALFGLALNWAKRQGSLTQY